MPKPNNYKTTNELLAAGLDGDNREHTVSSLKNGYKYHRFQVKDRPLIIRKEFSHESYNGPTLDDFITRLNTLHETAIFLLQEELKAKKLTQTEYERKVSILNTARSNAAKQLSDECDVDTCPIDELREHQDEIIKIIGRATDITQQYYLFKAIALLKPEAFQDKKIMLRFLAEMMDAESKLTGQKVRPDFINIYENPAKGLAEKRVSIQRTINKTIPSTERLDRKESKGLLPNFVECNAGYLDENGQFVSEFSGYRHSSFPPIKVLNDYERQKKTAVIVKDLLTELARQKITPGSTEPIELNLSSLTLLTPYHATDFIIPNKAEYEYKQLAESYDAIMMYNGRRFELMVDGRNVKVKLNVNLLNAPGNTFGVGISQRKSSARRLFHSELEKNINAQGMSQFIRNACEYFKDDMPQSPLISGLKNIKDKTILLRAQLVIANQQLEKALNTGPDSYMRAKDKVNSLNEQIYKLERETMREYRQYVKERRSEISNALDRLKVGKQSEKGQVMELFLQTLLMYMDGKTEPFQYGARFLLANQKMGRFVDFYCKSGEDRTGRMQNLVEELCIFYRQNGRYPSYDVANKALNREDAEVQDQIAVQVNEFSVSRDITGQNSLGARGLQITGDLDTNRALPARVGDALGKTAKGVYSMRDLGVKQEIKKKVPGLEVDTKRQNALKEVINDSRGNVLLEENSRLGFNSRLVRGIQQKEEARTARTEIKSPSYIAHRLGDNDVVFIEKSYKSKKILAQIQKDKHSVKDLTKVPPSGLPSRVDEEIAIEQAFAMISPPFNAQQSALVLSGHDHKQVARIHAVLLVLAEKIPSLKELEIRLNGSSPRPIAADKESLQQANKRYIGDHLSKDALNKIAEKKMDLKHVIETQQKMKSFVKAERAREGELDIVEGTQITPRKS